MAKCFKYFMISIAKKIFHYLMMDRKLFSYQRKESQHGKMFLMIFYDFCL